MVNWKQRHSIILLFFLYYVPQELKCSQVWEVLVVWWTTDLCEAKYKPAQEDIVFHGNRSIFLFLHQILCSLLVEGSLYIRSCLKIDALCILALRLGAAELLQVCKRLYLCIIHINSHQAQQGPGHF